MLSVTAASTVMRSSPRRGGLPGARAHPRDTVRQARGSNKTGEQDLGFSSKLFARADRVANSSAAAITDGCVPDARRSVTSYHDPATASRVVLASLSWRVDGAQSSLDAQNSGWCG